MFALADMLKVDTTLKVLEITYEKKVTGEGHLALAKHNTSLEGLCMDYACLLGKHAEDMLKQALTISTSISWLSGMFSGPSPPPPPPLARINE